MGVDSYIFDEVSKTCFYFDRKYNFIMWSDDEVHNDIINRIENSEAGRATSAEIVYVCNSAIAHWTQAIAKGRAYWSELIKEFAEARPDGSFFTASDHDSIYSGDIKRDGKYKEVSHCRKCGWLPGADWQATCPCALERIANRQPMTEEEQAARMAGIQALVKALENGSYNARPTKLHQCRQDGACGVQGCDPNVPWDDILVQEPK